MIKNILICTLFFSFCLAASENDVDQSIFNWDKQKQQVCAMCIDSSSKAVCCSINSPKTWSCRQIPNQYVVKIHKKLDEAAKAACNVEEK